MEQIKASYGTAIIKAVRILNYLSEQTEPKGVSEIARETGLNKATVFKLLETLQSVGFVEKTKNTSYHLGIGLIKLAHSALQQVDLVRLAYPYLENLNEQTGETVHLGVLDGDRVVYVAKLESKQSIRMYSKVGKSSPLYCTGLGKAILSTFSDRQLSDYLEHTNLQRFTNTTLCTAADIINEVQKIRANGYAVDNSEHEQDVRCIAVPLFSGGKLFGAISVTAPSYRMTDEKMLEYLPFLKQCRNNILERLVFQ